MSRAVFFYEFKRIKNDQVVLRVTQKFNPRDSSDIYWLDKNSNIVHHYEHSVEPKPLQPWVDSIQPTLMVPIPALFMFMMAVGPYFMHLESPERMTLEAAYIKMWQEGWPALVYMIPVMLIVGWLVTRHEKSIWARCEQRGWSR